MKQKSWVLSVSMSLLLLPTVTSTIAAQKNDPFNETQEEYDARAQWFRDAKVGVFIHWNPSSLVGQEISWCRNDVGVEKYDQLYKQFKGENFNADEWIKLFEEAGIRYAVFVPKHHDGFSMFDTKTSDYSVMHSPFGRDYIKEVSDACRRGGVQFCLYYSVMDWWSPLYSGKAGADLTAYKNEVFKPHIHELLTRYGPVGCIWFDGNWEASWTHADGREMYGFIRRLQSRTLVGNRIEPKARRPGPELLGSGEKGVKVNPNLPFVSSFYDAPDAVGDYQAREMMWGNYYDKKVWDSCYNLSPSPSYPNGGWSWITGSRPRPLAELANWIVECIGRNGNALLGVGPKPDGTIAGDTAARLLELGDWLKRNGEAIYGTRGGPYLPGAWGGVSTRKGKRVFLLAQWWIGDSLVLPALPAKVTSARLIAGGTVTVETEGKAWRVRVPKQFHRPIATIVELTLDRNALALDTVAVPGPDVLSLGKAVTVSGEWKGREEDLSRNHVNDGDFDTIWAGPENSREGWVQFDLGENFSLRAAMLDEGPYDRCRKFELRAQVNGAWQRLVSGTTIGHRKRVGFEATQARHVRLVIQEAVEVPTLAEFQVFGEATR